MNTNTKGIFGNLAHRFIHRMIKRHIYAEFYHLDDGTHYGQFAIFGYVYSSWLNYEDRKAYTVLSLTFEDPAPKAVAHHGPEFENFVREKAAS